MERFLLIAAIALMFPLSADSAVVGDINGDAKIDLAETIYSLQISAGIAPRPVPTVVSAGGRVWMAYNLGASRVATGPNDSEAYGDLYQWGRLADGHQKRGSSNNNNLSGLDAPDHGDFIVTTLTPFDWRENQNNNLWQSVSGRNNPCPAGFRVPTSAEWETERLSWSPQNDAIGAFESPLKLVAAGYRNRETIYQEGGYGYYWSNSVSGIFASYLDFNSADALMDPNFRAHGMSVRCIMN